jgi:hypothetical protein
MSSFFISFSFPLFFVITFVSLNHDKWGMGVRHALFPMPALGASGAAGFPTLFSTASGVFGLVAGPSSASPRLDFE